MSSRNLQQIPSLSLTVIESPFDSPTCACAFLAGTFAFELNYYFPVAKRTRVGSKRGTEWEKKRRKSGRLSPSLSLYQSICLSIMSHVPSSLALYHLRALAWRRRQRRRRCVPRVRACVRPEIVSRFDSGAAAGRGRSRFAAPAALPQLPPYSRFITLPHLSFDTSINNLAMDSTWSQDRSPVSTRVRGRASKH